jgi:hypothetical protein
VEGLGLSCYESWRRASRPLGGRELRTRLPRSLVDIFFFNITIINWDVVLDDAIHVFKHGRRDGLFDNSIVTWSCRRPTPSRSGVTQLISW